MESKQPNKSMTNGHAGPSVPAPPTVVAPAPKPTKKKAKASADDFAEVQAALNKATQHCYAEGLRRGASIIAIAVGRLDGAAKKAITDVMDQLELELHEAEEAAASAE